MRQAAQRHILQRDETARLTTHIVVNCILVRAGAAGQASMARVRDEQCTGCGVRILPHIIQELHQEANEEIYRCEMCGLILYTLDPIPVANPGADGGKNPSPEASNSASHS